MDFKLAIKLARIERKLDMLIDMLTPKQSEAPELDDAEAGVVSGGIALFDLPAAKRFKRTFLEQQIDEHGTVLVRKALLDIQDRIATGRLDDRGPIWKALLGAVKRFKDNEAIYKAASINERALPLLVREGEPLQIGRVRVQWRDGKLWIEGREAGWVDNADSYVIHLARKGSWEIKALTPAGVALINSRFKMFSVVS